jgi:hypothetical protein
LRAHGHKEGADRIVKGVQEIRAALFCTVSKLGEEGLIVEDDSSSVGAIW